MVTNMKQEALGSPAISVIVPIYNMEKLMRKCLDSILAQTFQDYECLLIDDGSKDGSPAICDEYAAKDPRFKAFHKPNGGLSDARNYGIERAQGDYTIFFDPDDWVDADCLKDMYAKAVETDADMVMCDLYYNDPNRQRYCKQEPLGLDHFSVLKSMFSNRVSGFTVTKLIKKKVYLLYDIKYPYGMYGCEDLFTVCSILKNNIKIAYFPKAYYHYFQYGNMTQSRRYDENTYLQDIKIRDMFVELLFDTPYLQLAYNSKTFDIFYRAYHFGDNVFTSSQFKTSFSSFGPLIRERGGKLKWFYFLAVKGYYHLSKSIFCLFRSLKVFFTKKLSKK